MSCWFLMVLQSLIDSPVNPATSSLPLVFVITVTAIKQGYEDWLRYRSDSEVNTQLVDVVIDGSIQVRLIFIEYSKNCSNLKKKRSKTQLFVEIIVLQVKIRLKCSVFNCFFLFL